jgi:hypothetical protein
MLRSKNLTPWPLTLKINRVPDSPKDYVCTKFGQNPLKDVDSRVFTKMLHGKKFTQWPWPLTLKINRVLDSPKYVPSLVKIHWRMLILECSQGCYAVKILPGDLDLWPWKSIGFQILLRTKYVPSLVKIHWRMLILECSQGCDGRTESSVTISLRNFVGEGIITISWREQFTQSLVLCVCFVDRCLSFCPFSFSHCVVCPLIYGFWLLLWYLQTGLIFNEMMMRSTLY